MVNERTQNKIVCTVLVGEASVFCSVFQFSDQSHSKSAEIQAVEVEDIKWFSMIKTVKRVMITEGSTLPMKSLLKLYALNVVIIQ